MTLGKHDGTQVHSSYKLAQLSVTDMQFYTDLKSYTGIVSFFPSLMASPKKRKNKKSISSPRKPGKEIAINASGSST